MYYSASTNTFFAMNNVYVRGFVPYESGKTEDNPEGNNRILVNFQDYLETEEEALLAGPPREGSKIGGYSLKKGTTLEQAKKVFTYGKDYSHMLVFGDLKEEDEWFKMPEGEDNKFIYHISKITKATKAEVPVEAPAPEAVLQA